MFKYIIKRLLQMIPLLIIISLIAFGIIRIAEVYAGADPLAQLKMNPATTAQTIQREKLRLGYETSYTEKIKLTEPQYTLKQGFTFFIQKPVEGSITIKASNGNLLLPVEPLAGEYKLDNDVLTFNQEDSTSSVIINYKSKDGAEQEIVDLTSNTYILNKQPLPDAPVTIKKNNGKEFKKTTIRAETYILKNKTLYFNNSAISKELEIQYTTPNSWYIRYLSWAKSFIQGDMGQSYYFKTDVNGLVAERLANTLVLSISTIFLTWIIAIPLGIYLAVKQYSWIDQICSSLSYFFMGFPDFFLAILLLLLAGATGWFPITGMTSPTNNNMVMVDKIFQGTYQHDINDKISPQHQEMDKTVAAQAEKSQFVNSIISDINLELSVEQPAISDITTQRLVEDIPKVQGFSPALLGKVTSIKEGTTMTRDMAKEIRVELIKQNPFSFNKKLSYILQHSGNLIYHYLANIPDVLYHLFLPTLTLAIISVASLQRRMRANLLDVLNDEYIRTARAKGLSENVVIYKHAVRNAINPIITLLGFEFASLLSGAAYVEIIFTWPGLGQMMLEAVLGSDLNLVMAGLVIGALMLLMGNLLADLLLALVDPRIKLEA